MILLQGRCLSESILGDLEPLHCDTNTGQMEWAINTARDDLHIEAARIMQSLIQGFKCYSVNAKSVYHSIK